MTWEALAGVMVGLGIVAVPMLIGFAVARAIADRGTVTLHGMQQRRAEIDAALESERTGDGTTVVPLLGPAIHAQTGELVSGHQEAGTGVSVVAESAQVRPGSRPDAQQVGLSVLRKSGELQ